ncbi:MAG: methyltransferase domain-containing protein [Bacteroidetes bacterium]|nr:methyltransferase domain-containing protein [Bacteroidota bacterium]
METSIPDISTVQKASWNKFSPGWKKWDDPMLRFLEPLGTAIIDHLAPQGRQWVLDIAAGTGEPGLSIARLLPGGTVVITDLAEGMLQVAAEKAARSGLTNVELQEADANALPFADGSFDAVSCRLGYMFFPDMRRAAREMARVLKPGGRIATVVWAGPEQNFWITCMAQGIARHIAVVPPDPDAPGMFRGARPGIISELFTAAGLKQVSERDVPAVLPVDGPQQYWDMMTEVAAPFVSALSGADAATVARVKADVIAAMEERYPKGDIAGLARVIVGVK